MGINVLIRNKIIELNNIDKYAKQILFALVKEGRKYYIGNHKYGGLKYKIDNKIVVVNWFTKCKEDIYTNKPITINDFRCSPLLSWDSMHPSGEKGYHFVLEVEGLRQIKVPNLTRKEEADILDSIEQMANWHEESTLKNIINIFIPNKLDNTDALEPELPI